MNLITTLTKTNQLDNNEPLSTFTDLVCISHLRWDFVYQRPQHLMSRAAKTRRVFFVEEPRLEEKETVRFEIRQDESGVLVVVPFLPTGLDEAATHERFTQLLEQMLDYHNVNDYTLWVYTPMPLPALLALSNRHKPQLVIYDCMDELANFRFAPPELREREAQLFAWADVVFTGGYSLYEAKVKQHNNVYPFPSSVDVDHFAKAMLHPNEPADLQTIPHPRVGFIGVIDERMDVALVGEVAALRPDLHFVMIGPVVKISQDELPKGDNVHYLGQKQYKDLPNYLAYIDVAMMPFAINDSTRFISPTKTPEYLAAGKPVISTPIHDVVRPYGEKDLVVIAETCAAFVEGLEQLLTEDQTQRRSRADIFVNRLSWSHTWQEMEHAMARAAEIKQPTKHSLPVPATPYTQLRYTTNRSSKLPALPASTTSTSRATSTSAKATASIASLAKSVR
ncbi:MAG: glycosyltransferase family 1 protein [Trueperaceae bacterium]